MTDDSREGSSGNDVGGGEGESSNEHQHRRPDRDELERRLAAFELDVRAQAAAEEEKRRLATPLEAREFVTGIIPPQAYKTKECDNAKVILAVGLDPRRDPTLVGQRNERGDGWTFNGLDGEIISPEQESSQSVSESDLGAVDIATPTGRRRRFLVLGAVAGLLGLLVLLWFSSQHPKEPLSSVSSPETSETMKIAPAAPLPSLTTQSPTPPKSEPPRAAPGGAAKGGNKVARPGRRMPAKPSIPAQPRSNDRSDRRPGKNPEH